MFYIYFPIAAIFASLMLFECTTKNHPRWWALMVFLAPVTTPYFIFKSRKQTGMVLIIVFLSTFNSFASSRQFGWSPDATLLSMKISLRYWGLNFGTLPSCGLEVWDNSCLMLWWYITWRPISASYFPVPSHKQLNGCSGLAAGDTFLPILPATTAFVG